MSFVFLFSWFSGLFFALIFAHHGHRFNLIDLPNNRSSHSKPIPRGGGFGILTATLICGIVTRTPTFFWLSIVFISSFSFLDDIQEIKPSLRLFAQFFSAFIIIYFLGFSVNSITDLIFILILFIFIVGTTNFFNFMDGINGLASGTGIISFSFISIFSYLSNTDKWQTSFSLCLAFACLGFLPLNFPKAKVFLGDVGSILLGFSFGSFILLITTGPLSFFCLTSFLFLFYADAITTIYIRILSKERILLSHRRHLYQILANELKIPHWKITLIYLLLQSIISLTCLITYFHSNIFLYIFLILCSILFVAFRVFIEIKLKNAQS